MKIVTIIGARPQIIKAAALSRAIIKFYHNKIEEVIVHTGQHYDENMSQVFFDELSIPHPNYNLNVGSGSHGQQTAKMLEGIEEILIKENPDFIVLYGDTNSTLAGAIAAAKLHIPITHIEAGLRSFNKKMPEEINRITCDHCATLLFSPTKTGFNNLIREGFNPNNTKPYNADNPKIYHCGDVMYDNSKYFATIAREKVDIINRLNLNEKPFILATIHRDNNTDQTERLTSIIEALVEIADNNKIVLPLHPRTKKLVEQNLDEKTKTKLYQCKNIQLIEPVSFLEMIELERNAEMIITDSGGVQKEAFFFMKPCIILRHETEWTEIVEAGTAILADANKDLIIESYNTFKAEPPRHYPYIFGDGHAAEFILEKMIETK